MASPSSSTSKPTLRRPRYEFRVWGSQPYARERLSILADTERTERVDDCYLLVGDRACNAKIRNNRLKVKRLIEVRFGFQRWSAAWHRDGAAAPQPFDDLLTELDGRQRTRPGTSRHLAGAVAALDDNADFRAVFVTKRRHRFRFGAIKAEATNIAVHGRPGRLDTVAIEGRNLGDLLDLRSALGLAHLPNTAMHLAVGAVDRVEHGAGRSRRAALGRI